MEQVKQDSNNNLYSIKQDSNNNLLNNLVDKIWTCKCGAWNAYYRDKCGACEENKPSDGK
jgi:hypothetical protein